MIVEGFVFGGKASINGSLFLRHNLLRITPEFIRFEGVLKEDLTLYPKDILSVKKFGFIPIIWRGVKFKVSCDALNGEIVFTTWRSPKNIINTLNKVGFESDANVF